MKQEEKERTKWIKNFENEIVRCEAEIAKPPPPDLGTIEQCRDDVVCVPIFLQHLIVLTIYVLSESD